MTTAGQDVRRPPTRWRLAFCLFGMRLPAEHRAWVASLLRTDGQVRRVLVLRLLPPTAAVLLFGLLTRTWAGLGGLVGAWLGAQIWVDAHRSHILKFQRIDASGNPVPPRGLGRLSNAVAWLLATAAVALLALFVWSVERGP